MAVLEASCLKHPSGDCTFWGVAGNSGPSLPWCDVHEKTENNIFWHMTRKMFQFPINRSTVSDLFQSISCVQGGNFAANVTQGHGFGHVNARQSTLGKNNKTRWPVVLKASFTDFGPWVHGATPEQLRPWSRPSFFFRRCIQKQKNGLWDKDQWPALYPWKREIQQNPESWGIYWTWPLVQFPTAPISLYTCMWKSQG